MFLRSLLYKANGTRYYPVQGTSEMCAFLLWGVISPGYTWIIGYIFSNTKLCFQSSLWGECLIRESLKTRMEDSVLNQEDDLHLSSGWLPAV